MVEVLVASGSRVNEAVALKPSDVDRAGRYRTDLTGVEAGRHAVRDWATKDQEVAAHNQRPRVVLNQLDYGGDWLFTATWGTPVRLSSWRDTWTLPFRRFSSGAAASPNVSDLTDAP